MKWGVDVPSWRLLPEIEGNNFPPKTKAEVIKEPNRHDLHRFLLLILTSHRKKSECFFSETLFTNSLNGRVLWKRDVLRLVLIFLRQTVFFVLLVHLYTKFLRRKSICGTVETWIFTSLSPPLCARYSVVQSCWHGPRGTPLRMAGRRWGAGAETGPRLWNVSDPT